MKDQKLLPFFSLIKKKRGQVRGIDFALAMLIFIIAFSQVILVLTNLLIPSIVQMENYSEEQEVNKIYHLIFYNDGNPSNWDQIGTSSLTDFRMGLQKNSQTLAFSKINRLTPEILDYWKIDYTRVKASYDLFNDFNLGIDSPLSIELNNITAGFGKINIFGSVKDYQTSLENVDIWAFAIDEESRVSVNRTITQEIDGSIVFNSLISVLDSQYYSIVLFAKIDQVYETYSVYRLYQPDDAFDYELVDFDFRPLVIENTEGLSSAIDIHSPRLPTSNSAEAVVLYPFSDDSFISYNQTLTKVSNEEGSIYQGSQIPIPVDGFAVVLVHETDVSTFRAGYMGIPMFLQQSDSTLFGKEELLSEIGYISHSKLLTVRNRLLRCQIWYN